MAEDGAVEDGSPIHSLRRSDISAAVNEDSIVAAAEILDVASINPALDSALVAESEGMALGGANQIPMLNQEQIR